MCVSALAGRKERSCSLHLGDGCPCTPAVTHLRLPGVAEQLLQPCGPLLQLLPPLGPVCPAPGWGAPPVGAGVSRGRRRTHRGSSSASQLPRGSCSPRFTSIFPPDHDLEAPASDAERTAYLDSNRLPQQQEVVLLLLASLDQSWGQSLKVSSHSWLLVTMGEMVTTLLPTIGY